MYFSYSTMFIYKNIKKQTCLLLNNLKKDSGFTLIELLVVIAILGLLATALIATIDPFEQIKKANDTNMQDIATEVVEANVRYYATHNALPWFTVKAGGQNCYTGGNTLTTVSLTNLANCMNDYVTEGELKQGFLSNAYINYVVLTNPSSLTGNATDTAACFLPTSKSEQKDPNTKYNENGSLAPANSCLSVGGANQCYWCTQ